MDDFTTRDFDQGDQNGYHCQTRYITKDHGGQNDFQVIWEETSAWILVWFVLKHIGWLCMICVYGCFKKNSGTPKCIVYNGKPFYHGWFEGPTFFWKHPYMYIMLNITNIYMCRLRSGGKDLVSSASYPRLFGSRVVDLHLAWAVSWLWVFNPKFDFFFTFSFWWGMFYTLNETTQ